MLSRQTAPAVLAALALAGCGSASVAELPPPAAPAASPALGAAPAGRVLELDAAPRALAFDRASGRLAVPSATAPELLLVHPESGAQEAAVRLPGPAAHLAAGPARGELIVPAGESGQVLAVSAPRGRVTARVDTGGRPHAAAVSGGLVAVTDPGRGAVLLLDGRRVLERVPAGPAPDGLTFVDDGRALAVVRARARRVELLDPATGRVLAGVPAGVGPTHIAAEADRLYLVDTQGDALIVLATRPELEVVRRVHLPGRPWAIAVDGRSHRLWVTLTGTNELVELAAHGRPSPLRTFPTVRQPDSLAVDEATGRVFVGGAHDGVVQVIEP